MKHYLTLDKDYVSHGETRYLPPVMLGRYFYNVLLLVIFQENCEMSKTVDDRTQIQTRYHDTKRLEYACRCA